MIQQITGQTAQKDPTLPITNQEVIQQAAAMTEAQAKVDTPKEEALAEEEAKKPPTDQPNRKAAKNNDTAASDRCLFFFSIFSSVYY